MLLLRLQLPQPASAAAAADVAAAVAAAGGSSWKLPSKLQLHSPSTRFLERIQHCQLKTCSVHF